MIFIVCFSNTFENLLLESGCILENQEATNFRELIISGQWTNVRILESKNLFICFVVLIGIECIR